MVANVEAVIARNEATEAAMTAHDAEEAAMTAQVGAQEELLSDSETEHPYEASTTAHGMEPTLNGLKAPFDIDDPNNEHTVAQNMLEEAIQPFRSLPEELRRRVLPSIPEETDQVSLLPSGTGIFLYNGILDGNSCAEEFISKNPQVKDKVVTLDCTGR